MRITKKEGDFFHGSRGIEEQPRGLFKYRILDDFARWTTADVLAREIEGIGCCRESRREGFDCVRHRFAVVRKSDRAKRPVNDISVPTKQIGVSRNGLNAVTVGLISNGFIKLQQDATEQIAQFIASIPMNRRNFLREKIHQTLHCGDVRL